jgi:hypothetical protein
MPQAPFNGTRDALVLTVALAVVLEVGKNNSPAQTRQVPKIPSKFTSEGPLLHHGHSVRQNCYENVGRLIKLRPC